MKKELHVYPGEKFGRLKVIDNTLKVNGRQACLCECDCGNEVIALKTELLHSKRRSCGCIRIDLCKQRAYTAGVRNRGNVLKHGQVNTRLYAIWKSIRQRCNNPKNKDYKNYGNRGITICEEWNDFNNFYKWAFENGYNPEAKFGDCTIDRINNDDSYSPSNCRWVDLKVQANNRRKRKEKYEI